MEDVKKQLRKIREDKSLGPDNMHPGVLMEVIEQVSEMLMDIYNSSLESGQEPDNWKVANITPLFEIWESIDLRSREELGNYRSVSLT